MSEPRNIEELAAQLRERGDPLSLAASGALLGQRDLNNELLRALEVARGVAPTPGVPSEQTVREAMAAMTLDKVPEWADAVLKAAASSSADGSGVPVVAASVPDGPSK